MGSESSSGKGEHSLENPTSIISAINKREFCPEEL
jgi:hypothetical protein